MSLRNDLLAVIDDVMQVTEGDGDLDFVVSQLTIETRRYPPGRTPGGEDGIVISTLTLPKRYPVKEMGEDEVAESGGEFTRGDVKVGPITPHFTRDDGTTGGYTPEQLAPRQTTPGIDRTYKLTGPLAGDYALVAIKTGNPLAYWLILRNKRRARPTTTVGPG